MLVSRAVAATFLVSAAGILTVGHRFTETAAVQQSAEQCRVTVSGAEKFDMMPEHERWEAAFRRHSTQPALAEQLLLPAASRLVLSSAASAALTKIEALRRSLPAPSLGGARSQVALDRDPLVAETIIDARDHLARTLSEDEFVRLSDQVDEASRDIVVSLPVPGRVARQGDGTALCELAVGGGEMPHLIPEYRLWEAFFDIWSSVANLNRTENGDFKDEYVALVGRRTLRMPASDIRIFLAAAMATSDAVKSVRSSRDDQSSSRELAIEVRRAVMRGRHNLVRALSLEGWRAVSLRLDGSRAGAKWWYRSPIAD